MGPPSAAKAISNRHRDWRDLPTRHPTPRVTVSWANSTSILPAAVNPGPVVPTPPGGPPPRAAVGPAVGTETVKPATPVKPVEINSIAGSVTAPGLADLLKQAEDLTRQQKFADAIG